METKKQAIERLKREGHNELYIVDNYITDHTDMVSTNVWFVYENEKDIQNYIDLCKAYDSLIRKDYRDLTDYPRNKENGYIYASEYTDQYGHNFYDKIKVTKVA